MIQTSPKFWKQMFDIVKVSIGGGIAFCGIATYNENAAFHRRVTVPLLHYFEPETAHQLSILALKNKLWPSRSTQHPPQLHSCVMGLSFESPIGLAAGYDKNGEAVEGAHRLGFGFVEIGSVTPKSQPGNPKPRVFRLTEDQCVINRYGFNSAGHEAVRHNLSKLPPVGQRAFVLGVNLGKNKTSVDHVKDYTDGVKTLGPYADYIVVNVSSPNTPGLRGLQAGGVLGELLTGVMRERRRLPGGHCPPILIKLAPDLLDQQLKEICEVATRKKIDGLIISNTTVTRPECLQSVNKNEIGGLSGKALEDMATHAIKMAATYTKGQLPIIGVGGVSDGAGVYRKLRAGASLVQLYSALVFQGPTLVKETQQQLVQLMQRDGFSNISEVIGKDLPTFK